MEVYDIGLSRPSILPTTIVMTMKFMNNKVFNYRQVMKYMDIGLLRPATL